MIALYSYDGPKLPSQTLLLRSVSSYTGYATDDPRLRVVRTPGLRPAFPALPELFTSVSHSGTRWMCAVGAMPLGLDLQLHEPCRAPVLSQRFFHPEEAAWLKERDYLPFFEVWCAKESYLKYTGEGMSAGLDHFSVVADGRLRTRIGDAWFLRPTPPEGYSLCLCAAADAPITEIALGRHR